MVTGLLCVVANLLGLWGLQIHSALVDSSARTWIARIGLEYGVGLWLRPMRLFLSIGALVAAGFSFRERVTRWSVPVSVTWGLCALVNVDYRV